MKNSKKSFASSRNRAELKLFSKTLARNILGKSPGKNIIPLSRVFRLTSLSLQRVGKSQTPDYETYSDAITYSSLDRSYLLRILREKDSKKMQMFLIHPVKEAYAYAFLRLNESEEEFMTDGRGRASLERHELDPLKLKVKLSPPLGVFRFSRKECRRSSALEPVFVLRPEMKIKLNVFFVGTGQKRALRVHIPFFREKMRGRKVVLIADGKNVSIAAPYKGIALFENLNDALEFQVNLYA